MGPNPYFAWARNGDALTFVRLVASTPMSVAIARSAATSQLPWKAACNRRARNAPKALTKSGSEPLNCSDNELYLFAPGRAPQLSTGGLR
jgi:hypothetical protein